MFRIAVLSDLHLECSDYLDVFASADVLVLAGDIASCSCTAQTSHKRLIKRAECFYGKGNVLEIDGNHTGYGGSINHFTNRQFCVDKGNVVLIGATLWSGEKSEWAYTKINDKFIEGFSWEWMRKRHDEDLSFIVNCLEDYKHRKCVVFTHHLPSVQCVNDKWLKDGTGGINMAFYTDLDHIIETYNPVAWIFGHTHDSLHKFHTNNKTQLVCNPRGYYQSWCYDFENDSFNPNKVLEIDCGGH